MAAIGYASLPIVPSLKGLRQNLERELGAPLREMSRQASKDLTKSLSGGAEDAAKAYERAQKRQERAAERVEQAEKAIAAAKSKSEQATRAVEAAEIRLEQARSKAATRVTEAEGRLEKLRASEKATTEQLAVAEEKVAQARMAGKADILAKENKLQAARDKALASAASVELAEKGAEDARRRAADATDNVVAAEKRHSEAMEKASASTKGFGQHLMGLDSPLGKVAGKLKDLGVVAAGALGVASVGQFFQGAIEKGRELDVAMGSLQAVTGSTADTMAEVSKRAKELGQDEELAGTSAASATDAMLALAKGGMNVTEAMDAAKGSIQLAGAAQIDAGQAAELQIAALNSFGLAADQAGHVADVLTNTANASATGIVELGESLKMAAPTASTLGVSLEDTNTMLGLFANTGVKGTMAGTAMRSALLSLTSPSKQAATALEELGVNAFDAEGKFVGMRKITEQLSDAQKRLGESKYVELASKAFGREAVSFATTAAQGGVEAFDQLREAMDRQGSAGETAGAKLSGLNGALDRFDNALSAAQQELYELFAPALTKAIDAVGGAITMLTNGFSAAIGFIKKFSFVLKPIAGVAMAAAGGIGAFYAAMQVGKAATAAVGIAKVAGKFLSLTKIIGFVKEALLQLGMAMALNPVGAIVLAISALVAGFIYLWKTCEGFRNFWIGLWENIKTAFQPVADSIKYAFELIGTAWEELKAAFQGGDWGYGALAEIVGIDNAQMIIDQVARVGEFLRQVRDLAKGVWDILFKGEYTGLPFGLEEDSPIVGLFFSIREAILGAWEAIKNLWASLQDAGRNAGLSIWESLKGLFSSIWDVVKSLGKALYDLWQVLSPVLMPVLKAVGMIIGGVLLGAIIGIVGAIKVVAKIIEVVAKVIAWLTENILAPLIEIIGEIVSWLIDKLAGAFTQMGDNAESTGTTLKDVWEGVKYVWGVFVDAISSAWENYIKPVWDTIKTVAEYVFLGVLTTVFLALKGAWIVLSTAVQWAWENVIKPAWDALCAAATWMWESVLQPTWQLIKDNWDDMVTGMCITWETILKPAWDALCAAATWMWENVLQPTWGFIKDAWDGLVQAIAWAWENLLKPTWDALCAAATWMWENVMSPVIEGIKWAWQTLGDAFNTVKDFIINNVFTPLQNGVNTVKSWFDKAVDGIGKAWASLREKTRKPVEFVVNTVYNRGILPAWNKVAGLVGMEDKKLTPVQFATGGVLPGWTPGRDIYDFVDPRTGYRIQLSGGEAIMRPEWVRAIGGKPAVDALNRTARTGGVRGVQRQIGEGAAYKDGGMIDKRILHAMSQLRKEHGKPYQYGGVGNPSWDCSGIWSGAYRGLQGQSIFGGRVFNTESNFGSFGFIPGLSGRVTIGVKSGMGGGMNGHMAGTIDGVNVESGGHGVQIGGLAAGSDNGMFNHTYTLKEFGGKFVSGGNGGGGGFSLAAMVRRLWDAAIEKIGAVPSFPGWFGELPKRFKKLAVDTVWKFVESHLPFGGSGHEGGGGTPGGGVQQWDGMVRRILREKGYDESLAPTVLRRMQQESGGNPDAINNWDINAQNGQNSRGLMQIIPSTFEAHKDPGFDNIYDPEANIRASMNYAVSRYGSLPAAYDRAGGYALGGVLPARLYDTGGVLPHGGTAVNMSGADEVVFTNEQWRILKGFITQATSALARGDGGTAGAAMRGAMGELGKTLGDAQARADLFTAAINDGADGLAGMVNQLHGPFLDTTDGVKKALEELEKAREEDLKNTESIEAAERELAEARESKDEKKIKAAEEKLKKAREDTGSATDKIRAAERNLAKARVEAINGIIKGVGEGLVGVFDYVADFTKTMASLAQQAEQTREALRSARVEAANSELNRLKALNTLRQAELDLEVARIKGAETTRRIGDTSVRAMGKALEEFRTTGVMAVKTVTVTTSAGVDEVAKASLSLKLAALDYAESSILSAQATEMQKILSAQLYEQQKALFGVSQFQYNALTGFVQGVVKIISGVFKIAGAIGAAVAAFIAGGPLGLLAAIPAVATAISGIADITTGAVMVKQNKKEAKEAWKAMDSDGKALIIGGAMGAVAPAMAGAAGAIASGSSAYLTQGMTSTVESSKAMSQMMSDIAKQRMDAIEDKYKRQIDDLKRANEDKINELKLQKDALQLQADAVSKEIRDAVNIDELLAVMRGESIKSEAADLVALERQAAAQRETLIAASAPSRLAREEITVQVTGSAMTTDEVAEVFDRINARVDSVELKIARVGEPSARDKVLARR